MKVLLSGSSGLIGSALAAALASEGHTVVRLVREKRSAASALAPTEQSLQWDPSTGVLAAIELEGMDAVVHLASENIASGRWTRARKERIRTSRVDGTGLLSRTLAQLARPPGVLVCASAIGYYGSRGEEVLTEESAPGNGFLADLVQEWEAASAPARDSGIRTASLRFGVVLSPRGGALAKMLIPFRAGFGGRIGNGRQYMSWIALDDVVTAVCHVLDNETLEGPVNVVAPNSLTNGEFARALGLALKRPSLLPLPGWAARLALGEMAEDLLLASTRVEPQKLLDSGCRFEFPELAGALDHLL
jgi:uncharacterized protein (TIGR01777 family)